jgi:hypothetical protein
MMAGGPMRLAFGYHPPSEAMPQRRFFAVASVMAMSKDFAWSLVTRWAPPASIKCSPLGCRPAAAIFPERLVLFDAAEPLTIKNPPSAAFHTIGA